MLKTALYQSSHQTSCTFTVSSVLCPIYISFVCQVKMFSPAYRRILYFTTKKLHTNSFSSIIQTKKCKVQSKSKLMALSVSTGEIWKKKHSKSTYSITALAVGKQSKKNQHKLAKFYKTKLLRNSKRTPRILFALCSTIYRQTKTN